MARKKDHDSIHSSKRPSGPMPTPPQIAASLDRLAKEIYYVVGLIDKNISEIHGLASNRHLESIHATLGQALDSMRDEASDRGGLLGPALPQVAGSDFDSASENPPLDDPD